MDTPSKLRLGGEAVNPSSLTSTNLSIPLSYYPINPLCPSRHETNEIWPTWYVSCHARNRITPLIFPSAVGGLGGAASLASTS